MTAHAMPVRTEIADLLSDLLGRDVTAKVTKEPVAPDLIAVYCNGSDIPVAAILSNLRGAASLAAALTMIPAPRVEEAVRGRALDDVLRDNYLEVCNIAVALVRDASSVPELQLRGVHVVRSGPVAADVAAMLATPAQRLDLVLQIDGYDDAQVALIVG